MHKLVMVLFFVFFTSNCLSESKVINVRLGSIMTTGEISKVENNKYALRLTNNNEVIVNFEFSAIADPTHYGIQVIDMNKDGYDDLVIAYMYGNAPYAYTNLYEYSVEDKTFRENKEFPGEGFPEQSNDPGCFKSEERLPPGPNYTYVVNEWCHDTSSSSWVKKSSKEMVK